METIAVSARRAAELLDVSTLTITEVPADLTASNSKPPLRVAVVGGWDAYGPIASCDNCDAALVDLDMAEDEDGGQYSVGRCPNCDITEAAASPGGTKIYSTTKGMTQEAGAA